MFSHFLGGWNKIMMKKPEASGIKYNREEGGSFIVHKREK
jgi:hypothetical protein